MLFKEITANINGNNGYPRAVGNDPTNWDCKPAGVDNPKTPGCGQLWPIGSGRCIVPEPKPIGIDCVIFRP
jgi:hypothetical protein